MSTPTRKSGFIFFGLMIGAYLLSGCAPPYEPSGSQRTEPTPRLPVETAAGAASAAAIQADSDLVGTDTPPAASNGSEADPPILTVDDRSSRLISLTSGWGTDWTRHTIEYDEILSGGPPRDGIPSIDSPEFETIQEAESWLAGNEPVITVDIDGDSRAYPLQILTWHEIANDVVGSIPVVVTFCPLCNSALVFDRRVDDAVLAFGVSGLLRNSDLIMYDRITETLWQQFTGEAVVGELAGRQLSFIPSSIVSFDDFRNASPDGLVLSRNTGYNRRYGENPYVGYDSINQSPFLFSGPTDGRLPPMERVVTVALEQGDVAYPLSTLAGVGVINDRPFGRELVVFHVPGTSSALGSQMIAAGEDVGATGVFEPRVDDQLLTFHVQGGEIMDVESGSRWNILGHATSGSYAGSRLAPLVHGDHFWFSWAAFKPDTLIYQP